MERVIRGNLKQIKSMGSGSFDGQTESTMKESLSKACRMGEA